jgi:hypothetical protein
MIATRLSLGAISESSSRYLPPSEASLRAKPVTFPLVEPRDDAAGDGVAYARKDGRDRPRLSLEGKGRRGGACHDDVGLRADQLVRERSHPIDVIAEPTKVDPHVAAIGPAQARKRLRERQKATLLLGIVFVAPHEHADVPYAALLRVRRQRPRRRAAAPSDEFAPSKANAHLALPYRGTLWRQNNPSL